LQLGGVLERAPQPRTDSPSDVDDVEATPAKGKGAAPSSRAIRAARTSKRVKGRTVYLPDDLFERIIVHAHRKDVTISHYIEALLERHVPDHRVVRATTVGPAQFDPGDSDAA
jgi:hypothetical protein